MSDEMEMEVQRTLGRLETKIDTLLSIESRVSVLETFSNRVRGAAWLIGVVVTTGLGVWSVLK